MSERGMSTLRVISTGAATPKATDRASVEIYRPFFLAGILCVLTVGCLLGALALHGVGLSGSYTRSDWAPFILAHANSQLFGWVGFFVMGFSLQQHAPQMGRASLFHRLAWASLILMALGIALRFVAEPLCASQRDPWLTVGVFASVLQTISVATFIFNIAYTRHWGQASSWQVRFVLGSVFWLAVIALVDPLVFYFSHQADRLDSIMFVAKWYPPLREAQFLGFVAMMIFGVSLVKLHTCFGAKEARRDLGILGFYVWILGLGLRMFGWVFAFDQGFAGDSQVMYFLGGLMLAVAAVFLVRASRIFEPLEATYRSHKFVRGAFAWLLISGALIVSEPLHLWITGAPFSHAFTGAVRHALTVGFISQMILGFGSHVVARMNDLDESSLSPLWGAFLLINIGNVARVALEVATDFTSRAFAPMGGTGFIELVGIAIWAAHVARPLVASRRLAGSYGK